MMRNSTLHLLGCALVVLFVIQNTILSSNLTGSRLLYLRSNNEDGTTERIALANMEEALKSTETKLNKLIDGVSVQSSLLKANEETLKHIQEQLSKALSNQQRQEVSVFTRNIVTTETTKVQQESDASSEEQDNVAACLLIKDDNHWLIEWLAFHYHVLPLRDLIVLVDPASRTSPQKILDRWVGLMNIKVWNATAIDEQVGDPKELMDRLTGRNNPVSDRQRHNARQVTFYNKCMQSFAKSGKTWVMLTDTDEFAYPNLRASSLPRDNVHPDLSQPGSFLRFVNEEKNHRGTLPRCIQAPRYQFGANKSSKKQVNKEIPFEGKLSGTDFLTTQWLYRWENEMLFGKNFVNVSMLKEKDYDQMSYSVHSVLKGICPPLAGKKEKTGLPATDPQSLAVIHHYIGTKEQFWFRDDPRNVEGGRAKYHESDKLAVAIGEDLRPWLTGFVNAMGAEKAYQLLEGVGRVGYEG